MFGPVAQQVATAPMAPYQAQAPVAYAQAPIAYPQQTTPGLDINSMIGPIMSLVTLALLFSLITPMIDTQ